MTDKRKTLASIMEHAWSDKDFRTALKADPKKVLRENGIDLPASVKVTLHHNTSYEINLVLPLED